MTDESLTESVALPPEAMDTVRALARRQARARGLFMQIVSFAGNQVEDGLRLLPKAVRRQIDLAARSALERSYDLASRSRGSKRPAAVDSDLAHSLMAGVSGALGGFGGLPTALAELPVATTLIFRSVQNVAQGYGEDPTSEQTRIECLRVFGSGTPDGFEDGLDTSFIGSRLTLSGAAVHGLIGRVAPRFAAVLSQKLAGQMVPIVGAVAGSSINFTFTRYYTEMAHVHFGLRALARDHGEGPVVEAFHAALAETRVPATRD